MPFLLFFYTWKLLSFTALIYQLPEDVQVCSKEVVDGLVDESTDVASAGCCVKKEFQTLHGQLTAQVIEEGSFVL